MKLTRRNLMIGAGAVTIGGILSRCFGGVPEPKLPYPAKVSFGFKKITEIGEQGGPIQCLAWSPDGHLLAASGRGNTEFELWDIDSWRRVWYFQKPLSDVLGHSLTFTKDGQFLIVSTALDHKQGPRTALSLIEVASGKAVHHIEAPPSAKYHIASGWALNAPGSRLAMGVANSSGIGVYETKDWTLLRTIESYSLFDRRFAFDPVNGNLATQSVTLKHKDDGQIGKFRRDPDRKSVEIWDVENGDLVQFLNVSRGRVTSLAYLPNTNKLITGSQGLYQPGKTGEPPISLDPHNINLVRLWDTLSGTLINNFSEELFNIHCVTSSDDGSSIGVVAGGGMIRILRTQTMEPIIAFDWKSTNGFLDTQILAFRPSTYNFAFNLNNTVCLAEIGKEL